MVLRRANSVLGIVRRGAIVGPCKDFNLIRFDLKASASLSSFVVVSNQDYPYVESNLNSIDHS